MGTVHGHERRTAQTLVSLGYALAGPGRPPEGVVSMVYGDGLGCGNTGLLSSSQVEVIVEKDLGEAQFEERLRIHREEQSSTCSPHILVGQLSVETSLQKPQGLGALSTELGCCYYSSISKDNEHPILEIWYNVYDDLSYNVPGPGDPVKLSEETITLKRTYQPLYFRYDLCTGQSTYLLTSQEDNLSPTSWLQIDGSGGTERPRLHCFSIHLLLMYSLISKRNLHLDCGLRRLVAAEYNLLWEPVPNKDMGPEETKAELQSLHDLSQAWIVLQHYNKREQSTIDNLLRDLDRVSKKSSEVQCRHPIDPDAHERLKDAFLCLKDFCEDRPGRLNNRKQRVQNLIALLYNLMANRDSTINLQIASESTQIARESASIAYETRRDSAAMKTIATMTMLYLPATFVSSLFGTNFFALSTNGPNGNSVFVVSELWWMYLVSAIPLTLLTLFGWRAWLRWRVRKSRRRGPGRDRESNV